MKKFVMICLLALPVTVACQQKASAWIKIGCTGSFKSDFCIGGCHFHVGCNPYPGECFMGYPQFGDHGHPVDVSAPIASNRAAKSNSPVEASTKPGSVQTLPAPRPVYYPMPYYPVGYYPQYPDFGYDYPYPTYPSWMDR